MEVTNGVGGGLWKKWNYKADKMQRPKFYLCFEQQLFYFCALYIYGSFIEIIKGSYLYNLVLIDFTELELDWNPLIP